MVAVNVTFCPAFDGLRDDVIESAGVNAAVFTVSADEPVPGSNASSPS